MHQMGRESMGRTAWSTLVLAALALALLAAPAAAQDWTEFRHDGANTGATTATGPSAPVGINWTTATGDEVASSPAVVDGAVYVGSDDGELYAIDASTGSVDWSFPTGAAVRSSPAVAGDTVYVGGGDGLTALNASTGAVQWRFDPGATMQSSPAVVRDTVYVGASDGAVYAVNRSDGTERWSYATDDIVYASPAVSDGFVYAGSLDGRIYGLDADTGALVWRYTTTGPVRASPAVAGDRVFVANDDGVVYGFERDTGTFRWDRDVGDVVRASPAVGDAALYVVNRSGGFYRLARSNGFPSWRLDLGTEVLSSPALTDGQLVVGGSDGVVRAIETGAAGETTVDGGDGNDAATETTNATAENETVTENASGSLESNLQPVASVTVSPVRPVVGEVVSFDASGSRDPDGSIAVYQWDFDGDGAFEASGPRASWSFEDAGEHEAALVLRDDAGSITLNLTTVEVAEAARGNEPPRADAAMIPNDPWLNRTVALVSRSRDPDGTIVAHRWDVDGDGETDATGPRANHTFPERTDYRVALTVEDDDGATDESVVPRRVAARRRDDGSLHLRRRMKTRHPLMTQAPPPAGSDAGPLLRRVYVAPRATGKLDLRVNRTDRPPGTVPRLSGRRAVAADYYLVVEASFGREAMRSMAVRVSHPAADRRPRFYAFREAEWRRTNATAVATRDAETVYEIPMTEPAVIAAATEGRPAEDGGDTVPRWLAVTALVAVVAAFAVAYGRHRR